MDERSSGSFFLMAVVIVAALYFGRDAFAGASCHSSAIWRRSFGSRIQSKRRAETGAGRRRWKNPPKLREWMESAN